MTHHHFLDLLASTLLLLGMLLLCLAHQKNLSVPAQNGRFLLGLALFFAGAFLTGQLHGSF